MQQDETRAELVIAMARSRAEATRADLGRIQAAIEETRNSIRRSLKLLAELDNSRDGGR
jgi:hypothetical protein